MVKQKLKWLEAVKDYSWRYGKLLELGEIVPGKQRWLIEWQDDENYRAESREEVLRVILLATGVCIKEPAKASASKKVNKADFDKFNAGNKRLHETACSIATAAGVCLELIEPRRISRCWRTPYGVHWLEIDWAAICDELSAEWSDVLERRMANVERELVELEVMLVSGLAKRKDVVGSDKKLLNKALTRMFRDHPWGKLDIYGDAWPPYFLIEGSEADAEEIADVPVWIRGCADWFRESNLPHWRETAAGLDGLL